MSTNIGATMAEVECALLHMSSLQNEVITISIYQMSSIKTNSDRITKNKLFVKHKSRRDKHEKLYCSIEM